MAGRPRSPATAETSPASLNAAERREEVLRLRKRGKSIRTIAGTLGVSKSQVHRDLKKELEAAATARLELADGLIDLEIARLEALEEEVWKAIEDGPGSVVVAAIAEGRRISESRRKLLGLDAAEKVEHSGTLSWMELVQSAADTDEGR